MLNPQPLSSRLTTRLIIVTVLCNPGVCRALINKYFMLLFGGCFLLPVECLVLSLGMSFPLIEH